MTWPTASLACQCSLAQGEVNINKPRCRTCTEGQWALSAVLLLLSEGALAPWGNVLQSCPKSTLVWGWILGSQVALVALL